MLTKKEKKSDNNNTELDGQGWIDKNTIYNWRIEYATTVTIDNNRFTTKCILRNRPEKKNETNNPPKIHQRVFEAIKQIDETAAIITQNNTRITNSNTFPTDKEHQILSPDQRQCF